ncbi:hypothetical protein PGTUg99_019431 [Puccinia graminis f. sp. tritici]|uniref:Uncharacterized protein n=1 Tax=Puccinia graminis f. sp. tritici TaxID=56615 RepID=A0A5B0PN21_PUCGR|nr:hypothetical protein PGTUg99_019431 [Puccinia graminis f. sp. tritici]
MACLQAGLISQAAIVRLERYRQVNVKQSRQRGPLHPDIEHPNFWATNTRSLNRLQYDPVNQMNQLATKSATDNQCGIGCHAFLLSQQSED